MFFVLDLSSLYWWVHTPQCFCPTATNRHFQFGFQCIKLPNKEVPCISSVPFNIMQIVRFCPPHLLAHKWRTLSKTKQENSILCCMTTHWAPPAHVSTVPVTLLWCCARTAALTSAHWWRPGGSGQMHQFSPVCTVRCVKRLHTEMCHFTKKPLCPVKLEC